jgi:16S rRNA (cytidine1402-2'-O)-methyltransferase
MGGERGKTPVQGNKTPGNKTPGNKVQGNKKKGQKPGRDPLSLFPKSLGKELPSDPKEKLAKVTGEDQGQDQSQSQDQSQDPSGELGFGKAKVSPLAPGLYILPTPLGNLEDLSLRQMRVLKGVSLVAAEDTRRAVKILNRLSLKVPLISYREENHKSASERILKVLGEGGAVALVSDAGTPLVSDPGAELVREAREKAYPIYPLPGPSAVTTALSASGMRGDSFVFGGFLPSKESKRRAYAESLKELPQPLVFFESPNRLIASLRDLSLILGPRECLLAREMTKIHEEYTLLPLPALLEDVIKHPRKGEITLVIEGKGKREKGGAKDASLVASWVAPCDAPCDAPGDAPGDALGVAFGDKENLGARDQDSLKEGPLREGPLKEGPLREVSGKEDLGKAEEGILSVLEGNKALIVEDLRPLKILAREWAAKTGFSKKTLYALFSLWRREEKK